MHKVTRAAALLLVALAVVLAIVAFSLSRRAMQPGNGPTRAGRTVAGDRPASTAMLPAVVASSALPAGQAIARAALRVAEVAQPVADGYTTVDAVVGDVPLVDIPAGTAITTRLLAHGVAMELKPGERALAVPVDELSGAGNRILPGDYVDVFLSLKSAPAYGTDAKPRPTQTRLLLSRLRVLAYGSENLPIIPRPAGGPAATSGASGKEAPKPVAGTVQDRPAARTAVLAVPVGEADRLLLGAQDGKLSLALRHPMDDGRPDRDLFPRFRPALAPLVRLDAGQRQRLGAPENHAYAGIDGSGLAAHPDALVQPAAVKPVPTRTTHRVEIIRGTKVDSP